MTPWIARVTYPSDFLHYIVDLILTLLIATTGIALVIFGFLLFA